MIRAFSLALRAVAWVFSWVVTLAAVFVALLWGTGRVLTDTVPPLQQLHWIPTVAALAVTMLALVFLSITARSAAMRRWRSALWIVACLQGSVLLLQDWRPLSRPIAAPAGTDAAAPIRIAHVNANWPGTESFERASAYARCARDAWGESGADVLFISETGSVLSIEAQSALVADDRSVVFVGRFGVVSRVPVLRAMALMDDGKIAASWVEFGSWRGNAPFTTLLVDLPSDPALSRRDVLARMTASLRGRMTQEPDLVIGDMNVARGSGSVASVWPRYREAFAQQGRGWGGTYPRHLPLWHIDLMLIGARVRLLDYSVRDPGAGKHSMQCAAMLFGDTGGRP
ncbi:MAG: hypothetical protein ACKO4V_02490 [Planctomycetota bacterium]